jgi:hypothetical protein
MRKLFLILLLAILPFQYAWSAAAAYCEHEQGKSTHFGHHSHQHTVQAEPGHDGDDAHNEGDDGHKPPAKGKMHADCAVCQFSVQASLLDSLAPPPGLAGTAYPPGADPRFSSHIADGPKRPDWLPAA